MSLRTVRSMRSLPSMRNSLHSSSSAPNPSYLLSSQKESVRTHFASLTVNALKQECRQRGLKVMGRKVELIDRIIGFEQAKSYSTGVALKPSAMPKKKAPTQPLTTSFSTTSEAENVSSIDSYNVPPPTIPKNDDHPVKKVPVGPDNAGTSIELGSQEGLKGDTGASAGDVHVVNETSRVSTMNVDLGDGSPRFEEEHTGHKPTNELPSSDKTFLWGLGGAIAAWWGSQWLGKKREE